MSFWILHRPFYAFIVIWFSWAWSFGFFDPILDWHSDSLPFIVFFDLFWLLLLWVLVFWTWQRPGTFSHACAITINVGLPSVSCLSAIREPRPLCIWMGNHSLCVFLSPTLSVEYWSIMKAGGCEDKRVNRRKWKIEEKLKLRKGKIPFTWETRENQLKIDVKR